jgi:hypothetical protein
MRAKMKPLSHQLIAALALALTGCAQLGVETEYCLSIPDVGFEGSAFVGSGSIDGTFEQRFIYDISQQVSEFLPAITEDLQLDEVNVNATVTRVEAEVVEGLENFSFLRRAELFVADPATPEDEEHLLNYRYTSSDETDGKLVMASGTDNEVSRFLEVKTPLLFRAVVTGNVPITPWKANILLCMDVNVEAKVGL